MDPLAERDPEPIRRLIAGVLGRAHVAAFMLSERPPVRRRRLALDEERPRGQASPGSVLA
jgi:hypothetical protein